jgi:hypothetical protein
VPPTCACICANFKISFQANGILLYEKVGWDDRARVMKEKIVEISTKEGRNRNIHLNIFCLHDYVTIEFSIIPDLIKIFCPSYAVWLLWQFDRLEPM